MKRYLNGKLVEVTPEQEAEFNQRMEQARLEDEQEKTQKQQKQQRLDAALQKLKSAVSLSSDELSALRDSLEK